MTETELDMKQKELSLREKNLHTMQELAFAEHMTNTQTIKKVSTQIMDEFSRNHFCAAGERFTRLEVKQDTIIETLSRIEKNQEDQAKKHVVNSKRLDRIETIGSVIVSIIIGSWIVFVWLAEKVAWR